MKIAFFSAKPYEKLFFEKANQHHHHDIHFFEEKLSEKTAELARNYEAICCFVTDQLNQNVLAMLAKQSVKLIALRSAGFNHVDIAAAKKLGLTVVRVPIYSPYAIAEFAVGLILSLNRKIHHTHARVQNHNFSLDNLLGFDLHGRTIGIIGTGNIGTAFASIMHGFGCELLAYDPFPNTTCEQLGVKYCNLTELYQQSDIISLHCPLKEDTKYLINETALTQMKPGVMIINTGRGGLIDTQSVIPFLENKKIGYLGLDVYEHEEHLFFQDLSHSKIQDELFLQLQKYSNVLITPHQAFFTKEAVTKIAEITLSNITEFGKGSQKYFEI